MPSVTGALAGGVTPALPSEMVEEEVEVEVDVDATTIVLVVVVVVVEVVVVTSATPGQ